MKFDVLIPVAYKDIGFVPIVINYIRRNIVNADRIFVLTNGNCYKKLRYLINDKSFFVLDEDSLIEGVSFRSIRSLLYKAGENRPSQTGWYFQQLLKFAFAHTKYAGEYYLSWDADTLPLNPIDFFDNEKPLFTKKIEYHQPYFDTMKRLLGFGRIVDYSFIAEHMLFKTDIVRELTERIETSSVKGNNWCEKIIYACDFSDGKANLFSEFETYGNYCARYHSYLYETRTLNTFRAAGLIRGRKITDHIIDRLALDLHIASFEMQDAPFPFNIEWNIYRMKRKLLSYIHRGG